MRLASDGDPLEAYASTLLQDWHHFELSLHKTALSSGPSHNYLLRGFAPATRCVKSGDNCKSLRLGFRHGSHKLSQMAESTGGSLSNDVCFHQNGAAAVWVTQASLSFACEHTEVEDCNTTMRPSQQLGRANAQ